MLEAMDDPSTSALLSYVPIDRLHALAGDRGLPAEVWGAAVESVAGRIVARAGS